MTLFDRSGHRAELTPEGELILTEARRVIQQARRLEQMGKELHAGYEPLLRIVLDGIFPMTPIMRAMGAFTAKKLPTRVRLMVEYLNGVSDRFAESEASLMLVLDYEGDQELSAIGLPHVPMCLLAHRDHPLNQERTSIEMTWRVMLNWWLRILPRSPRGRRTDFYGKPASLRIVGLSLQDTGVVGRGGLRLATRPPGRTLYGDG